MISVEKAANELAKLFLAGGAHRLGALRVHQFKSSQEAHDDEAIDRLRADFISDFDRAQTALSATYSVPVRVGIDVEEIIPFCGIFRFAVWDVEGLFLYLAAAHEDRGSPILLALGTASRSFRRTDSIRIER